MYSMLYFFHDKSKKPKIRGFGWSFNGMREQGSLKGEGTHRGNLFAYVNLNKIWQPVFKSIYEENLTN